MSIFLLFPAFVNSGFDLRFPKFFPFDCRAMIRVIELRLVRGDEIPDDKAIVLRTRVEFSAIKSVMVAAAAIVKSSPDVVMWPPFLSSFVTTLSRIARRGGQNSVP